MLANIARRPARAAHVSRRALATKEYNGPLDESFKGVVDWFKPVPKLTHRQQVMRLYRKAIRSLRNAAPDCRDTFHDKVDILRSRFDEHFLLPPDSAKTARLVREGYEELERRRDPDPYLTPFMPGGTMFMRNPPPPLESLYPEGIPEGVSRRRVNIDFSNIPDDQPYADRVFVDSISKDYWIDK